MITLNRITKRYRQSGVALANVDLRVNEGDFLFIAGASGAGKSSLLRILYGAERPTEGEVIVAGRNLSSIDSNGIADLRRDLGIVFQDYKLLPRRTVAENVSFGLEARGVRPRECRSHAIEVLKALNLSDRADDSPLALSGGEQQRVAIARALIHKPKLILADEPTGNLDREMTWVIFNLLLEAHAAGCTVVVATHDLSIIEELNLRTIVLDRGKVIGDFDSYRRIH